VCSVSYYRRNIKFIIAYYMQQIEQSVYIRAGNMYTGKKCGNQLGRASADEVLQKLVAFFITKIAFVM